MFRRQEVGVDLGTTSVRIFVKGQGIVLREPAVVALAQDTHEVGAVGSEAAQMLESEPASVTLVRPLRDGMIADHALIGALLRTLLSRVKRRGDLSAPPDIALCIPSGMVEAEKRAALQVAHELARHVFLVEQPLAAALGAGMNVSEPAGSMIVHVGGSRADIAVVSSSRLVAAESLPLGGNDLDELIVRMARHKHNLLIGERTAEEVKLELGAADLSPALSTTDESQTKTVRGRDLNTGTPKTVSVRAEDVVDALRDPLRKLARGIKRVLEATPPERAAEVVARNITLSGGGARLRNLSDVLQQQTGLPVTLADIPADCAALGLGRALKDPGLRAIFLEHAPVDTE